MDVDVNSRPVSRQEGGESGKEMLNSRGKIVISGEDMGEGENFGYCKPGDEDCG